jgi:hypothetical protein
MKKISEDQWRIYNKNNLGKVTRCHRPIHFTAPINAFTAHRQRGITDRHMPRRRDEQHDYIRWCFAPLLRYSRRNFPAR